MPGFRIEELNAFRLDPDHCVFADRRTRTGIEPAYESVAQLGIDD